jgi:hypothetical protein
MQRDSNRVILDYSIRRWHETYTYRTFAYIGSIIGAIFWGGALGVWTALHIIAYITWVMIAFALAPLFVLASVLRKHRIMSIGAVAVTLISTSTTLT